MHPPLKGGLKPPLNPVEFEDWYEGVAKGQNEFLKRYKPLAERVFERSCKIRELMVQNGIGQGSASQILPSRLTIKALADEFGVSPSTVQSVKRVVDSIPVERLPTLIEG